MLQSVLEFTRPIDLLWNHKLITIAGIKLSLGNLTVALILLLFAHRLSKLATRLISKRLIVPFVPDRPSQITYETFAFYGSLVSFVALSLTIAGIPLTIFTVVGGALAIGVGFGSQNIVNNFISGVILLVEKPIRVGDVVELENVSGTVISIGTRSTKIKNADSKIFIIPNSFFLEKSVLNWSYQTPILRTSINFGVTYETDVHEVENICMDIMLNTEGIQQNPMPKVIFEDFAESSLNFRIIFWCNIDTISTIQELQSVIRFKINKRFKDRGISMPFPQRDMNLKIEKALDIRIHDH